MSGSTTDAATARKLAARPIPTTIYEDPMSFAPTEGSTYFHGATSEQRSRHLGPWAKSGGVEVVRVEPEPYALGIPTTAGVQRLTLYDGRKLDRLWETVGDGVVYVDLTGLPHHAWAPLIASALRSEKTVRAVYVEPSDYTREPNLLYDLSEAGAGIRPLPGFASLLPTYEDFSFVPLLGFEDTRFSFLLNTIEPATDRVYPVVGIPGFRPEYPFETYRSNLRTLQKNQGGFARNARFADAVCPFRLYYVLEDIAALHPQEVVKVGLLGTKPHALGAVLYAIRQGNERVELVYDHPNRKSGRSNGTKRLMVYHVSAFMPPTELKRPMP